VTKSRRRRPRRRLAGLDGHLYWDQVRLVLVVIFAVVVATEIVTAAIRSRVI
jgi:ABC-type phosphate/phosphonate transport system permease subunit